MKKIQALGLIETYGFIGAVEALDIATKTANVELLGIEFIGSGLVTIKITGDVGAVKVSVDAAVIGANKIGKVVAAHVIARPCDELTVILKTKDISDEGKQEEIETLDEIEKEIADEVEMDELVILDEKVEVEFKRYTLEELIAMKVVELRTLVRGLPGIKIKRNKIKFMNKEELLVAIQEFYTSRI